MFPSWASIASVVDIIAFSPDGKLLASKSDDDTIRLWNAEIWQTVAIISSPKSELSLWIPALAFHPNLPQLATSGSGPNTRDGEGCREILIYELDYDVLLAGDNAKKFVTTIDSCTLHSRRGLGSDRV